MLIKELPCLKFGNINYSKNKFKVIIWPIYTLPELTLIKWPIIINLKNKINYTLSHNNNKIKIKINNNSNNNNIRIQTIFLFNRNLVKKILKISKNQIPPTPMQLCKNTRKPNKLINYLNN